MLPQWPLGDLLHYISTAGRRQGASLHFLLRGHIHPGDFNQEQLFNPPPHFSHNALGGREDKQVAWRLATKVTFLRPSCWRGKWKHATAVTRRSPCLVVKWRPGFVSPSRSTVSSTKQPLQVWRETHWTIELPQTRVWRAEQSLWTHSIRDTSPIWMTKPPKLIPSLWCCTIPDGSHRLSHWSSVVALYKKQPPVSQQLIIKKQSDRYWLQPGYRLSRRRSFINRDGGCCPGCIYSCPRLPSIDPTDPTNPGHHTKGKAGGGCCGNTSATVGRKLWLSCKYGNVQVDVIDYVDDVVLL